MYSLLTLVFWLLRPDCCYIIDCTAETKEDGAHQAEVDGWSHFIPEEMTVKPGRCFIFPHYSWRINSLLMDLFCCVKKHQPLCVCINSKLPCMQERWQHMRVHTKNKKNRQIDVPNAKNKKKTSLHASLSTGPQSPHCSPQQWNRPNSLSTGQTSTKLQLWLTSPPTPQLSHPQEVTGRRDKGGGF